MLLCFNFVDRLVQASQVGRLDFQIDEENRLRILISSIIEIIRGRNRQTVSVEQMVTGWLRIG